MAITTAAGVVVNYGVYGTTVTADPDPRTCNYTHFDLTAEQLGRTKRYNCWGFTFLPRRYWINSSTDVDNIIRDNCVSVLDGSVQRGDVIRYRDDSDVTTHTGRVWETDGAGHATLVRSKWGGWAEYIHLPADVPDIYGTHRAFFRQEAPLLGVADLWIKDSPGDDGEQSSDAPWWTSPDVLMDVAPYDGVPDANPTFGAVNRVWARVTNRSNLASGNAFVRYYWADPSLGLPASSWQLIPGTPGHPNPAGPINVPGNSTVDAPYVEWTPSASPAHQCLLAIAYVNDDPKDSANPTPLVYPFDVPWENGIGQRNVHIINANAGSKHHLSVVTTLPFKARTELKWSVAAVLTHASHLPVLGQPLEAVPLDVGITVEGARKVRLGTSASARESARFGWTSRRLMGDVLSGAAIKDLALVARKRYTVTLDITVPESARRGSVYYLHVVQKASATVTGGYTVAVVIE